MALTRWEELFLECLTNTNAYRRWVHKTADRINKWGVYNMGDKEVKQMASECMAEMKELAREDLQRAHEKTHHAMKQKDRRLHGQKKDQGEQKPPSGEVLVELGVSPLKLGEEEARRRAKER